MFLLNIVLFKKFSTKPTAFSVIKDTLSLTIFTAENIHSVNLKGNRINDSGCDHLVKALIGKEKLEYLVDLYRQIIQKFNGKINLEILNKLISSVINFYTIYQYKLHNHDSTIHYKLYFPN